MPIVDIVFILMDGLELNCSTLGNGEPTRIPTTSGLPNVTCITLLTVVLLDSACTLDLPVIPPSMEAVWVQHSTLQRVGTVPKPSPIKVHEWMTCETNDTTALMSFIRRCGP